MIKIRNKRGQTVPTGQLFLFIIIALLTVILIGVVLYAYNIMTVNLLAVTTPAGQVNFSNATAQTIGQLNEGMINQANIFAILILLGMSFAMVAVGFVTREKSPLLLFILDFIVVLFAYILSTYISNVFETLLNTIPFASTFINEMNFATTFLLKLPLITVVLGALIMIVTYSAIPRTREEVLVPGA